MLSFFKIYFDQNEKEEAPGRRFQKWWSKLMKKTIILFHFIKNLSNGLD